MAGRRPAAISESAPQITRTVYTGVHEEEASPPPTTLASAACSWARRHHLFHSNFWAHLQRHVRLQVDTTVVVGRAFEMALLNAVFQDFTVKLLGLTAAFVVVRRVLNLFGSALTNDPSTSSAMPSTTYIFTLCQSTQGQSGGLQRGSATSSRSGPGGCTEMSGTSTHVTAT